MMDKPIHELPIIQMGTITTIPVQHCYWLNPYDAIPTSTHLYQCTLSHSMNMETKLVWEPVFDVITERLNL